MMTSVLPILTTIPIESVATAARGDVACRQVLS
jgi:hypothetical protein